MRSVTTELVQLHFSFSTYSGYFVLRSFYTLLYFALSPWEFLELRLMAGAVGGQRRGWFGISGNLTIVSAYPFRRVTPSWTCLDENKHRNESYNRWGNYRVKFLHLSFCSQGGVSASVHPGIPPPPPPHDGHCSGRYASFWNAFLLPPATKLGQGYLFTGVCDSVHRGVSGPGGPGRDPPGSLWNNTVVMWPLFIELIVSLCIKITQGKFM